LLTLTSPPFQAEKEEKDAQEAARKADLEAKLAAIESKKAGKKLK